MSISRQNLTVIIVTLKSEHIIDQCIQSIDDDISIIVVENSSNKNFKDYLEKKYRNVSCILSSNNIGMGAGNNIGIENAKSDFVLILNPDVILFKNTIDKLIKESNNLREFAIMSPISDNVNFPNYSIKEVKNIDYEKIFEVDSIDGFCMLINKNKIKSISKDAKTFDENFFMYLENDDLCKRVKKNNEKIFIVPTCKVKHFGAKGVSENYLKEVELSRNWHWSWSKFYFSKKHDGYLYALLKGFPKFLSSIIKCFFYYIIFKKYKSKIYYNRAFGFFNAMVGKSSWYRPNIDKK
jgi:GT2 family glycosyltransferase